VKSKYCTIFKYTNLLILRLTFIISEILYYIEYYRRIQIFEFFLLYSLSERSFSDKVGLDDGLNRIQPML